MLNPAFRFLEIAHIRQLGISIKPISQDTPYILGVLKPTTFTNCNR